jgi:hypothetical protein
VSKTDLRQALTALEPKTKAAKLREVMPLIEEKIKDGVRIAEILSVLQAGGLELTEGTLKSYLHRSRKKQSKPAERYVEPGDGRADDSGPSEKADEVANLEGRGQDTSVPASPVSMQDLDRIMKPDPVVQANELAQYERIGKQQRRNHKS